VLTDGGAEAGYNIMWKIKSMMKWADGVTYMRKKEDKCMYYFLREDRKGSDYLKTKVLIVE
jgi:hypothetical protein